MVQSLEDLEGYLRRLERRFERLEDGTFLVAGSPDQPPLALRLAPPVLVVQVQISKLAAGDVQQRAKLFEKLLELNATDLLHAAYGLEAGNIVLSAALPLEHLDLNELEAVLADVDMALDHHIPVLRALAGNSK
ncbi:MAG TPA: YbjN domain-containing protein [Polyangiaceae bacterium]|jgi:hypothetical protein